MSVFFIREFKPRTERVNFFTTEDSGCQWLSQPYWSVPKLLMCRLAGSGDLSPSLYCVCLMDRWAKLSMTFWLIQYDGKPYCMYKSSSFLLYLNNIAIFKCFPFVSLCLPHLWPPMPFLPLRELLFSQVVFSPPTHPPPPSLSPSLPVSPAENDSVYFYPLVLSTLSPFHPFSLSF